VANVDDIGARDPLDEQRIPRRKQRLLKVPVGSRRPAPDPAPAPAPAAGPARSRRRVTTGRPHGLRDEPHDSGKTIVAENTFFGSSFCFDSGSSPRYLENDLFRIEYQ